MSQRDLLLNPVSNLRSPYYPEDSRVNRSVLPGSEKARSMTVISGRRCSDLLQSVGRLGCLERTLLVSSVWNSIMRLLIWKISDTPSGRSVFQLVPLKLGTNGSGCSSLLPTPDTCPEAPNKNCNRKYPKSLLQAAVDQYVPTMFPTPRGHEVGGYQYSRGNHDKKTLTLTGVVTMFPTPNSLNGHNSGTFQERGGAGNKLRGTSIASLKVSPDWEEWLMGFPPGWTKISDKLAAQLLGKQSSRCKSTRSSKRLQTLKGSTE